MSAVKESKPLCTVGYFVQGLVTELPRLRLEPGIEFIADSADRRFSALSEEIPDELARALDSDFEEDMAPRLGYSTRLIVAEAQPAAPTPGEEAEFRLLDDLLDAIRIFREGFIQIVGRLRVPWRSWRRMMGLEAGADTAEDAAAVESLLEDVSARLRRLQIASEAGDKARVESLKQEISVRLQRLNNPLVVVEVVPHISGQPVETFMRLSAADCRVLRAFWRSWRNLDKSDLRGALDAFQRALAPTPEAKVAALVQSLESLLSEGPGDLKFKVALRGSFLLEPSRTRRPVVFELLKKAYDVRSDVVHGKPKKEVRRDLAAMEKITGQTLEGVVADLEKGVRHLIKMVSLQFGGDRSQLLSQVDAAIVSGRGVGSRRRARPYSD
jgi:hypothetical protein